MRVSILAFCDVGYFPGLVQLAKLLTDRGAKVQFVYRLPVEGLDLPAQEAVTVSTRSQLVAKIPFLRGNAHIVYGILQSWRPDWIIAEHEYAVPSLGYKMVNSGKVKLAGYFVDYVNKRYGSVVKRFAHHLDAYVDVCDLRVQWRQQDWPRMRAKSFVLRQCPLRRDVEFASHHGRPRIVFTSSRHVMVMGSERLARFFARLCAHGITVDWYFAGSDEDRQRATTLLQHPLYRVHGFLPKLQLFHELAKYDVGLHWAPLADRWWDRSYFPSAASNKIGEYIAAALVAAHAGNPGLSYLPADVCAVFDPTNPEQGADNLADQISDRAVLERKRAAALRYHWREMHFEAQVAGLLDHMQTPALRADHAPWREARGFRSVSEGQVGN